ncbi:hypothetical protein [Fusobacterium sp. MFO224]|uniref:hypothetical protein n=1 Tax=Fusobacterium sp. MFO224 TaxID=3378070 RepID=UPI003852DFFC
MNNIDGKLIEEIKTIIEKSKGTHLATIEVASKEIGIGVKSLRKMTDLKDFPCLKIGVKKLIIMNKMNEWFDEHKGETFNL